MKHLPLPISNDEKQKKIFSNSQSCTSWNRLPSQRLWIPTNNTIVNSHGRDSVLAHVALPALCLSQKVQQSLNSVLFLHIFNNQRHQFPLSLLLTFFLWSPGFKTEVRISQVAQRYQEGKERGGCPAVEVVLSLDGSADGSSIRCSSSQVEHGRTAIEAQAHCCPGYLGDSGVGHGQVNDEEEYCQDPVEHCYKHDPPKCRYAEILSSTDQRPHQQAEDYFCNDEESRYGANKMFVIGKCWSGEVVRMWAAVACNHRAWPSALLHLLWVSRFFIQKFKI